MAEEEIQQPPEQQKGLDEAASNTTPVVSDEREQASIEHSLPFPIAGIGASAGGVEACIELFKNLPSTTGMAFVVIPHLSADQKSHLPEIIARHTKMETVAIKGNTRPEPNRIYFLPPNAQVALQDGMLKLTPRASDGPFRPIDSFFQSLASEQKNLAVGVVLSGMDGDGSIGLKTIKGEGGIAIVQSPESARFPEMPRSSILADHVDSILPPERIADHLAALAYGYRNPELNKFEKGKGAAEEEKHLIRILNLLKSVSGVDFKLYKPGTIQRRMTRRMLMHRVGSVGEYASFLQGNPKELRDLQEDILINVTRFFRDPEVFEALQQTVFPQILENRPTDQQLRIWAPGCSSGEEVYSIAICLLEFLSGSALEPPIQIFGTDASEHSIQKARTGIYPESIANEVSAERLHRFFKKTERGYQLAKRIRDLCIFARQNLCTDPPFSRLDLISSRNVLIYFGSQLQRQLISTFHYALRPDGFLLLGTSETIREFTDLFVLADRKNKIYSKVGGTPSHAFLESAPRVSVPDFGPDFSSLRAEEDWNDLEMQRTADRIVLARYGPPGVVVNDRLEILHSRGHTRPFLELAQGAASLQLSRMAREEIAPHVTAAVRRAIEQDLPVQVGHLRVRDGDEIRETTLEVLPMHNNGGTRTRHYLVLFVSPPLTSPSTAALETPEPATPESDQNKDRLVAQLRQDLSANRAYMQSLIEDRDAKNHELISANEEIQSANEELQSTNEELETTKEELQSSNEELQTVNDELQNRNAVLTQATNDLSNLLNSVNLPVLMLSNEFNIRHFTPQTQRLMNVRASDIGRPFGDIRLNLKIEHLEPIFTEVLDTLGSRELEVQDREGRWYLLRVRPYRTADNKIEGLVVALMDIDQLRRSQQELRDARDFGRSIIEGIPLPLVVADGDFRIRSTNEAFSTLTGVSGEALERRLLLDLAAVLWGMDQPLRSHLETLRGGKNRDGRFEFEHRTMEEIPKTLLIRGRILQPDGVQFLLVTFQDITVHKEAERLLQAEGVRLAGQVASTTKELDRSREDLRALTGSLMTSQEDERRRLARELHDDISQRLATLSIDGDDILRNLSADPAGARQRLDQLLARLGQLSEDVRTLSHGLHPSMIEDLGLAPALRMLTNDFGEREDMITTFIPQDAPEELPVEVATGLYRIAQEALRNVAKHAGKTHVKVLLSGKDGSVEMQISDSGRGYDRQQHRAGLGLISMEERARLIGATVHIESAPREGTKVTVHVPLDTGPSNGR